MEADCVVKVGFSSFIKRIFYETDLLDISKVVYCHMLPFRYEGLSSMRIVFWHGKIYKPILA